MDLKHLLTFVTVAEQGTVSAAARLLRIAQPALSRQIAALEAELGLELFARVGRRLLLTKAGEVLLQQCRTVLREAADLKRQSGLIKERGIVDGKAIAKPAKALSIQGRHNARKKESNADRISGSPRSDRAKRHLPLIEPARPFTDAPAIAVLPFQNLSEDANQAFLGYGLAEDIITELSRLRWLHVAARNSSFAYNAHAFDVMQVSRDLGVRYVLEGSTRRMGNRLRITGQLIDASTGSHIWAERYDRKLADIFLVQDEITSSISAAIGPAISDTEQQRAAHKPPETLSAWEAYHRGMWHVSKQDAQELLISRGFFERAIALDPDFARAHTALASTYLRETHVFNLGPLADGIRSAEPIARKAIFIDGNDANARAMLAVVVFLKGNHAEAIDEADYALTINPNCADAIVAKGLALVFSGRGREGRRLILQYLSVSPQTLERPLRLSQLAASYYFDGEYETAALTARQAFRQHPNYPNALRWLAASLGQLGRTTEANKALQMLLRVAPSNIDLFARAPMIRRIDQERVIEGLRKAGWSGGQT